MNATPPPAAIPQTGQLAYPAVHPLGGRPLPEPGVPVIVGINRVGLQTLYLKEVRRFFKVQLQTVWAPAITTLLFLAIFTLALGGVKRTVLGVPYADFLAPGLIVMGMVQNSFANSSSSLLIAKIQGSIVDLLMPPLSTGELLFSLVAGAVTRAWLVGLAVYAAMLLWPDVGIAIHDPLRVLFFGTAGAMLLALIGVLTGMWADKFDHAAAVTNFVIQPLTLLSGTFYAIDRLHGTARAISLANPFFYMIDGFRSGFIGVAEASPLVGGAYVCVLVLALWVLCYGLLKSGWKLRT
jgi:ABC-2 type transport system permease protein